MGDAVLWCMGSFCPLKSWGFDQMKVKLNQTSYHSIPLHQLMVQGFLFMPDNDTKHTSKRCQRYNKSKEELHVLQLMSCPAQSAELNWCGMNLTEKSEL